MALSEDQRAKFLRRICQPLFTAFHVQSVFSSNRRLLLQGVLAGNSVISGRLSETFKSDKELPTFSIFNTHGSIPLSLPDFVSSVT
jgi:hypothetical protein